MQPTVSSSASPWCVAKFSTACCKMCGPCRHCQQGPCPPVFGRRAALAHKRAAQAGELVVERLVAQVQAANSQQHLAAGCG